MSAWANSIFSIYLISALCWLLFHFQKKYTLEKIPPVFFAGTAFSGLFLYIFILIQYLIYPNFSDHLEALCGALGWLALNGQTLYPPPGSAERYQYAYGPATHLLNATALWLAGGSIWAAKIGGIAASITGLYFCACITFRKKNLLSLLPLCFSISIYFYFESTSFWNRPDSYLISIAWIMIWAIGNQHIAIKYPISTAATLGALMGISINLKALGLFYSLPLAIAFLRRKPPIVIAVWGITSAVVTLAPFAMPNISLEDYLLTIAAFLRIPKSPTNLFLNLAWMAFLWITTLVATPYFEKRSRPLAFDNFFFASLFLSMAVVSFSASIIGAGPYYLLPFVPIAAYSLSLALQAESPTPEWRKNILFAIGIGLFCNSFPPIGSLVKKLYLPVESAAVDMELRQIAKIYKGNTLAMGYSSSATYPRTFLYPLLIFSGNPMMLDGGALMAMHAAKVKLPKESIQLFDNCSIWGWLLPNDSSFFSLKDYEHQAPIFHSNFRNAFLRNYQKKAVFEYFSLWTCAHKS